VFLDRIEALGRSMELENIYQWLEALELRIPIRFDGDRTHQLFRGGLTIVNL
jgi:hypothetical protein